MELVNDRIGIAYPVVRGIPRLTPADARMLNPAAKQNMVAAAQQEEGDASADVTKYFTESKGKLW